MPRTHDHTLLASLGFADNDKRNPLHSLACQYLSTEESGETLREVFLPKDSSWDDLQQRGIRHEAKYRLPAYTEAPYREHPIVKGTKYNHRPVGYLDVVVPFTYYEDRKIVDKATGSVTREYTTSHSCPMLVEVKAGRVEVDEILRQVNTYRELIDGSLKFWMADLRGYSFVVATCYHPRPDELDALRNADIRHVLLGSGFERWRVEQEERQVGSGRKLIEL